MFFRSQETRGRNQLRYRAMQLRTSEPRSHATALLDTLAYLCGGPLGVYVAFELQPRIAALVKRYAPVSVI